MSYPYLEQFLETLETLPADMQRNFILMNDLDSQTQDLVKNININSKEYLKECENLSPSLKSRSFNEIQDMFGKAKELSEDKIQLAMQTYEMVDKHIRRLDSELLKLESELKEKQINLANEESKKRGRGRDKKNQSIFNPKNVIKDDVDRSKKKQKQTQETPLALSTIVGSNTILGGEVLDMPVDPNEPTYCICHQVSYGEMIGCDNMDCPIEWFHFGCVGLTQKPKGKWYCFKCLHDKKKK